LAEDRGEWRRENSSAGESRIAKFDEAFVDRVRTFEYPQFLVVF
jgi:hypothetical protein